ncbi:MAG TPA: nuclear transport factor 2 family protein [Candidatus Ornithomonoglobus merdipullorum]|uniref:Nuclear transport factor 2 family protein n=1 Tax=Candidatus Ornithomonoglobus merdipullorum TaxID=2840895 RepID=A0A9D1SEV4_9FIRM|nr:nuclear transport factor 2 family protein [Candidatus Ornithomonoglobus merdipullorum]
MLSLEKDLFRAEKITDKDWLDAVLHDDFKELGKSGVIFNKKDTIDSLSAMKDGRDIKIYNFECTELKNGCCLVHYVTRETGDKLFYRTSVWIGRRLIFHQASELNETVQLKMV